MGERREPPFEIVCPTCSRWKSKRHYLCSSCWAQINPVTKRRLWQRDDLAVSRLLQLFQQVRDAVPLNRIEVDP